MAQALNKIRRCTGLSIAAPLAAIITLSLAGCVTDGPRDAGGTVMSMSEPKPLAVDQTDLNIALWIDQRLLADIQRVIRDNQGINERMNLHALNASGSGAISTQRLEDGFFALSTGERLENLALFKETVESRLKSTGIAAQDPPTKIDNKRSYKTLGYKTVVTLPANKGYCFVARVGYRFNMLTSYTNERGSPDTIMDVIFCKATRDFLEFERLVAEVGVMKPADAAQIRGKAAGTSTLAPRGI